MHKDSFNIAEQTPQKNFDFFNTKVIVNPTELNMPTRITLAIVLSIANIIAIPYIFEFGYKTGDMVGDRLSQSINRDITSLK